MDKWIVKLAKLLLDNWRHSCVVILAIGLSLSGFKIAIGPLQCEKQKVTSAKAQAGNANR